MSNVAPLLRSAPQSPDLGPAVVTQIGVEVWVEREGRRLPVTLALAQPYSPAVGDVVLVIGNEEGSWVIGVIQSRGRSTLRVDGDLDIEAGGEVRIAGRRLHLEAAEVSFAGQRLHALFESASQRFGSLVQSVRELAHLRAGETHTVVEGTSHTQARSASLVTEEKVRINGKAIHLG